MNRLRLVAWSLSALYPPFLFLSVLDVPRPLSLVAAVVSTPIFFVAFYLLASYSELGGRRTLYFLAASAAISYAFEFLGVHYGLPFGKYYYTKGLGLKVLGVPVYIPLLWASLGFYSLAATGSYLAASLAMVAMDLAFDPFLTIEGHLWLWQTRGPYYGVPITNFIGWFVVSMAFYYAYDALGRAKPRPRLVSRAFYLEYVAAWSAMDFVSGLWLAGAAGLLAASLALALGALTGT